MGRGLSRSCYSSPRFVDPLPAQILGTEVNVERAHSSSPPDCCHNRKISY